jgi:uncharacterized protein YndB with AHSA1/START domain
MNSSGEGRRILGTLGSADGLGVVRMEDRFDTDVDDVWSAITEPRRLARWLGEVEGELKVGGIYRFRFVSSGAEGSGRVEECDPPHHFLLHHGIERQTIHVIEATLEADGDQTFLVLEERGMPLGQVAAYGAGIQIHVEDLGSHLRDEEPDRAADARWSDLEVSYAPLAADLD